MYIRGLLSVIFSLVFVMTLTSCNQEGDSDQEDPIKNNALQLEYWTPFSGGDNQFMTQMVDQFNKEHAGIYVVQVNSRLDDYYSRLSTAILAGNAPDVAIIHTTSLPQFVHNGYIEDLTASAQKVELDWSSFNENILKSAIYDGQPYAVPLDTHALVMYYNKDYLQMGGLLDPDDKPIIRQGPQGFVDFLHSIQRAVPSNVAPMAQPSTRIDSVWLWWSLYNQLEDGGDFYNEEGTRAVIDNPQALKALTYVNELYQSKLIPPHINDAFKMFNEGKAAVLFTGMWGTGAFEQNANLNFGALQVPVFYDRPAVWGDSHTLAIPTKHAMSEAKLESIMEFMKWMVEHGAMWAEAGHVPSYEKVVESDIFSQMKYRTDYAETANHVEYWPRHDKQWSMIELIIKEFEKMIYGQLTPSQALQEAQQKINSELAK